MRTVMIALIGWVGLAGGVALAQSQTLASPEAAAPVTVEQAPPPAGAKPAAPAGQAPPPAPAGQSRRPRRVRRQRPRPRPPRLRPRPRRLTRSPRQACLPRRGDRRRSPAGGPALTATRRGISGTRTSATGFSSPTRGSRARTTTGCSGSAPTTSAGGISGCLASTSEPGSSWSRENGTRFRSSTASTPARRTRRRPVRARCSSMIPFSARSRTRRPRPAPISPSRPSSTFTSGGTSAR